MSLSSGNFSSALSWIGSLCGLCVSVFAACAAVRMGHRLHQRRAYILILSSALFFLSVFLGAPFLFDRLDALWGLRPYNAQIQSLSSSIRAPLYDSVSLSLQIRNGGSQTWDSTVADGPGFLSWHVLNAEGAMLRFDNRRIPFPHPLPPGETAPISVTFCPFEEGLTEGRYYLDFDVVCEGQFWFADRGSLPCRVGLEVTR